MHRPQCSQSEMTDPKPRQCQLSVDRPSRTCPAEAIRQPWDVARISPAWPWGASGLAALRASPRWPCQEGVGNLSAGQHATMSGNIILPAYIVMDSVVVQGRPRRDRTSGGSSRHRQRAACSPAQQGYWRAFRLPNGLSAGVSPPSEAWLAGFPHRVPIAAESQSPNLLEGGETVTCRGGEEEARRICAIP